MSQSANEEHIRDPCLLFNMNIIDRNVFELRYGK